MSQQKQIEYIGTLEAVELLAEKGLTVTNVTLINWCHKFKIGKQLSGKGGRWFIDKAKLEQLIEDGIPDGQNEK